ncbi:S9 family peptidase, partial [Corynebacterium heidelbergense]
IDPQRPHPAEQVFLDCNAEAEGHEFFSLGASSVTTDGTRLAYSVDVAGDERFTLKFRDLTTGEDLPDVIKDVFYGATWVGRDTVYYQRVDESWRPHQVWRHRIGTPVDKDELVFEEKDERFWVGLGVTRSERYLIISTGSKVTSENWYLDLRAVPEPTNPATAAADHPIAPHLTCVLPRQAGVEYGVDHVHVGGEDYWLVIHNRNGVNSELARHPVGPISSLADCETMVPHRDDARVEGVDAFRDHIVLEMRENAVERVYVMDLRAAEGRWGSFQPLEFGEELEGVTTGGNPEWDAPVLRVAVSSFTTPAQVYDVEVASGRRVLRKEQEVLPGPDGKPFDSSQYVAERRWVQAQDGARIPVSLVHHVSVDLRNAPAEGHPVLLYGYGSYEASMDPYFSIFRLSLMERGVVFAIAHVRGGGEMGRLWYDHGKGLHKKNTFTDFVAVADALIEEGITSPTRMVAEGGSAGGLLMGAVANMAGDRFAGILAVVPFVDPLTSILKPELPLTVTEWDEWGDPYHEAEVYDYMAEYAPYENISASATYPPILAITSLNDTRVLYVEPAKWVAKLRHVAGADVLLKTEMEAGHGGVSGRYEGWRQSAFETAWQLDRMGAGTT